MVSHRQQVIFHLVIISNFSFCLVNYNLLHRRAVQEGEYGKLHTTQNATHPKLVDYFLLLHKFIVFAYFTYQGRSTWNILNIRTRIGKRRKKSTKRKLQKKKTSQETPLTFDLNMVNLAHPLKFQSFLTYLTFIIIQCFVFLSPPLRILILFLQCPLGGYFSVGHIVSYTLKSGVSGL